MNELYHYGIKRRSGRYPYGSGDRPYQELKRSKKIEARKTKRIEKKLRKDKNPEETNEAIKRVFEKNPDLKNRTIQTIVIDEFGKDIPISLLERYIEEMASLPLDTPGLMDKYRSSLDVYKPYKGSVISELKKMNKGGIAK